MLLAVLINGLVLGCIYSLVALGYSLSYRAMGLLNFAQGEMITVGALVGYTMIVVVKIPYSLGIIVAILIAGLLAVAIERLVYSRLRKKEDVSSPRSIFVTIGMMIIIANGAKFIWGSNPLSYPEKGIILKLGSVSINSQYLLVAFITALVMICLNLILFRTKIGIAMRAVADDAGTASLMGIGSKLISNVTSFLSGALGAVAGVLLAQIFYASFDLGVFGLKALAAAILGGFGSILGAALGGIILGIIETTVSVGITSEYKDAIVFALLIGILLFKPTGMFKN